ncbi:MAG: hypothetical protein ABIT06_00925 [Saprospiraceae bacterium]
MQDFGTVGELKLKVEVKQVEPCRIPHAGLVRKFWSATIFFTTSY